MRTKLTNANINITKQGNKTFNSNKDVVCVVEWQCRDQHARNYDMRGTSNLCVVFKKQIVAFRIAWLTSELSFPSPYKHKSIFFLSDRFDMSPFKIEMVSRRIFLSLVKNEQRKRKWEVDSISSRPQLQIGLKVSAKKFKKDRKTSYRNIRVEILVVVLNSILHNFEFYRIFSLLLFKCSEVICLNNFLF